MLLAFCIADGSLYDSSSAECQLYGGGRFSDLAGRTQSGFRCLGTRSGEPAYLRALDSLQARPISGTANIDLRNENSFTLVWWPDSRSLDFVVDMRRGHLYQAFAMPEQRSHCAHFLRRTIRCFQQSHQIEKPSTGNRSHRFRLPGTFFTCRDQSSLHARATRLGTFGTSGLEW